MIRRPPSSERWYYDKRLAGLFFFLASAQFVILVMIGEALASQYGYSIFQNPISDLGILGASQIVFNSSLFTIGLFNILGGLILQRSFEKLWVTVLFVLGGIGGIGASIFTLATPGMHGIFALLAFLFFGLEALAIATLVRGPFQFLSIGLGTMGLAALVLHALEINGVLGPGGMERMIVYPLLMWLASFGGYLMTSVNSLENLETRN